MMMFLRTIPDSDSDLDVATREFLRIASETPPASDMTVDDCMLQALAGECLIYAVVNPEPIGVIVLKQYGEVLNVVLLGGENVTEWKQEAKEHCVGIMKQLGAKQLCIVGRVGWLRMFPELELVAAVFTFNGG